MTPRLLVAIYLLVTLSPLALSWLSWTAARIPHPLSRNTPRRLSSSQQSPAVWHGWPTIKLDMPLLLPKRRVPRCLWTKHTARDCGRCCMAVRLA